MKKGDQIRYTTDNLGVVDPENPYKFLPWHVQKDDVGTYVGPHPDMESEKDWHLTEVERSGDIHTVPVHSSHFEAVAQFTEEEKAELRKQTDTLNAFAAKTLRKLT